MTYLLITPILPPLSCPSSLLLQRTRSVIIASHHWLASDSLALGQGVCGGESFNTFEGPGAQQQPEACP